VGKYRIAAFRGYFESNAEVTPDNAAGARMEAPAEPGTYRTLFQSIDQQGTSSGKDVSFDNLRFEGVIPYIGSTPTGVQPTIVAIDADGTCRYFNLQGRQLNGKPDKGLYIENGKKVWKR
jgi:hypothetical protein